MDMAVEQDLSRVATRLSSDYFFRALGLISSLHGGDITAAIIWQAIVTANTAHLDAGDYRGSEASPPDDLRRPVSVLSLSQSLGMPFETTRRYVNRMIAAGRCERVRGGVVVPASVLNDERTQAARLENLGYLRRLGREMLRAGIIKPGC
ncbi:hypothetical protein ACO2Q3_15315 [Caulobacter sp. KR2-114]|uniref:hypothetical protein n=1 Tax=Caulobacter sp. KR2-114 TaxID=3400912 RepID=UPI003C0ED376